jgi:predicted hydrocarbon binding protein
MSTELRPTLGNFSSIACFKSAILGMEDALGPKATAIAMTTAGRARGKKLATELGISIETTSLEDIASKIRFALGIDGTRLCTVEKITQDGDQLTAYISESLCSAGEPQGSDRKCTFTLGAVWGALEKAYGKRLQGVHAESVLRGGSHDVFVFTPLM